MRHRSFISAFAFLFGMTFMVSSCEDMLTPELTRYTDEFAKDSVYSAFGILKTIQNVGERSVLLDAARSDLATIGTYTTDSIRSIAEFENPEDGSCTLLNAADYYHIINSCNFYLAKVDTTVQKNGVPEMLREYAAIQSIRAWTYLQLVRFYGSVPFILEPMEDTDQASELERNAPRVTKNNLADLLLQNGFERVLEIQRHLHLPNYGSINNGSTSISSRMCFIPALLVMADAYLMQNNYERAAATYYEYFDSETYTYDDNNETYTCSASRTMNADGTYSGYRISADTWLGAFRSRSDFETMALTFGAANATLGKTLTAVAETFGFETSSRTSTDSEGSTSGSISTSANERYQQILPSQNYISLNEAQKFCLYQLDNNVEVIQYVEGAGDGRLYGTAPYTQFVRGEYSRIIDKFCPGSGTTSLIQSARGFSNLYHITLYRKPQIYLHFAEAINRLGFPQHAFGILKDGLIRQNFPTLSRHNVDGNSYVLNPLDRTDTLGLLKLNAPAIPLVIDGVTVTDTLGAVVLVPDTAFVSDGVTIDDLRDQYGVAIQYNVPYFSAVPESYSGGMYYLTVDEMVRAENYEFLDFYTKEIWNHTNANTLSNVHQGIHSRGCGRTGGRMDTIYTYAKMVAKKVAENRAVANRWDRTRQLAEEETLHHGDTLMTDLLTDAEIINAVEDIILDESALETAFEGHRFTDLLRVADHKRQAGFVDGTNWLAWKMARRNVSVEEPVTTYDNALYSKMQDEKYWYFELPKKK